MISEISIPFNFCRIDSNAKQLSDLEYNAEWFNRNKKPLQSKDELIAKFVRFLFQHVHKIPNNPPARDHLIFKNPQEYYKAFAKYLESINTIEDFKIFHGATEIDFNELETTPSDATSLIVQKLLLTDSYFGNLAGMQTSVEAILNSPETENLCDYFQILQKNDP